jgi:polysaccharide chain length determinant protein (PEP-CTERM system associated)
MDTKLLFFYLHGIWRRKWIAAAICWTMCIAGWIGIFSLKDVYQSQARVYVDVDSLLTPLLRGLAVESNPLQQLDFMQRTLLSRPNLEQVIHLADLDSQTKTATDKEDLLKELATDVKVNLQGTNLFSISYEDSNAVEGKNIVQAVLTVFSETTAGTNRSEMDNARRFLEEQIASYEKQLRAAETRRAQFREKYGDILPDQQANESRLQQAKDAAQKLELSLQDAQARRDEIAKELATTPTTLSFSQAAAVIVNNGNSSDPRYQLSDAKRKLADLQSRYTNDYPDVVAAQRDVTALEKEIKDQASAKDQGAQDDPSRLSTSSNPVYEQLKLRLADADSSVASLKRQASATEDDEKRIQEAVNSAPGIQLQAQNLDRDYDVLKKNYDELVQRREAANLAQAADTEADKIQFRIVDSPQVPLQPVAPNRPLLYSGVLVAGLGAGIAAAFLLVQLDRSYSSIANLRNLGLPVLGAISRVALGDSHKRTVRDIGGLAATAVALLIVYSALMVANFMTLRGVI